MYKEDVPEGPQCAQVITQLVNAGANIIFATSYGYQPELVAAAAKYPNVIFEQATGTTVIPKHLAEYYGAGEDGDFLGGMAAGAAAKASGNNKIGFVVPYPIPECLREVDAFTMGAQLMDPKATVQVVWTNTWFAPATERHAAESLVSAGVSVLADGQDSPTTGQVASGPRPQVDRLRLQPGDLRPQLLADRDHLQLGPVLRPGSQGRDERHLEEPLLVRQPGGRLRPAWPRSASRSLRPPARPSWPRSSRSSRAPSTRSPAPSTARTARSSYPRASTLTVMQKYSITWFVKGVIGNPKG